MMKKYIATFFMALLLLGCATATSEAYDGYPEDDTWVLNYQGWDIYVKAGTLDRHGRRVDAAPNFDAVIICTGGGTTEEHFCEFKSKGMVSLKMDGNFVRNNDFANRLYTAIFDEFHYYFYGN